ncbi:MAG: carboxypeptidase-like regulatory domain-containing protein, partial [Opitutales bacterium]
LLFVRYLDVRRLDKQIQSMKTLKTLLLFVLTVHGLSAVEFRISVVDSNGLPIEGAEVALGFDNAPNIPRYFKRSGKTDEEGLFVTRANANISMSLVATMEGYYKFGYPNAQPLDFAMRDISEVFEYTVRMREIKNPIPLLARMNTVNEDEAYHIPEKNVWIGFDFQKFDWVKPYGRGETTDIKIKFRRHFHHIHVPKNTGTTVEIRRKNIKEKYQRLGWEFNEEIFREFAGVWSGTLEIGFPRPGDGWVRVEEDFVPQSMLQMPHEAPDTGYQHEGWSRNVHSQKSKIWNVLPSYGYFLRTRTEMDSAGNVKTANYTKISGEIGFHPVGRIWMTYYFNPTPNDRNLELDPQKNLIRSNNRYNPVQNLLP